MARGTLEPRGEQAPVTLLAESLSLSRPWSLQLGPSRGDRELAQILNQLLSITLPA